MNYEEAKTLGESWTKGHDTSLDGWRSVIAVLLQRISLLEMSNGELTKALAKMQLENEALALDLGLKEMSHVLPPTPTAPKPQLQTIADIIKECEGK